MWPLREGICNTTLSEKLPHQHGEQGNRSYTLVVKGGVGLGLFFSLKAPLLIRKRYLNSQKRSVTFPWTVLLSLILVYFVSLITSYMQAINSVDSVLQKLIFIQIIKNFPAFSRVRICFT